MANKDIRAMAICSGVKLWQVAEILGITDTSLSRKLRKELCTEEKERIFAIIDNLAQEGN